MGGTSWAAWVMTLPVNTEKKLVSCNGYSAGRKSNKMEAVFADTSAAGYDAANWQLWRWWHIDRGSAGTLAPPSLFSPGLRGRRFLLWGFFIGGNLDGVDDACGPLGWGWMRTFGCQQWGGLSGSVRSPRWRERRHRGPGLDRQMQPSSPCIPHHPHLSQAGICGIFVSELLCNARMPFLYIFLCQKNLSSVIDCCFGEGGACSSSLNSSVFNKSCYFFFFFPAGVGVRRSAEGATLDDWEEHIRAPCETAIDFTAFFSARLCCSGPFGAAVWYPTTNTLWGVEQSTGQSTGCLINQYDLLLEHWFSPSSLPSPPSSVFCSLHCPLGDVGFLAHRRAEPIGAHYLGVL